MKKGIVVLYHGNCLDGSGAAWVAWKKFKDRASYIPVQHGAQIPEGLEKKDLYFIDFCYPKEVMDTLRKANKKIVIIDHHESHEKVIKSFKEHLYDTNRSGSVLAWQYFYPTKRIPRLLHHVEDSDLWTFTIPYTKEILAALRLRETNPVSWNRITREIENVKLRKKYIEQGKIVLAHENNLIQNLSNQADMVRFEGHKAYVVNSPFFISEVGDLLVKRHPPIAIIWHMQKGKIKIGLRTDGTVNAAKIAAKYNGGGHKGAAAFRLKATEKFPWKPIKKEKKIHTLFSK